jgi:hypothetical protein
LGTGRWFRYTGAGSATFTGIAGGESGREIRIVNTTSSILTLSYQNAASLAANRIVTSNGLDAVVKQNGTVSLLYDATAARWRVYALPVEESALNQGGNAFGTTVSVGSDDTNPVDIITGGATALALDTSGNATLTGGLTVTGGSVATPAATSFSLTSGTTGAVTLDSGTTGGVNLGTGSNAKTITIGNATGATQVDLRSGSGGIALMGSTAVTGANTFATGTGTTTINSTNVTLAGNSTVVDMTGSGTLGLDTTSNAPITTGTGLLTAGGSETVNGGLIVSGDLAAPHAANYSTSGVQNDVNLGTGELFRYTNASPATFTGLSGGTDGRIITLLTSHTAGTLTLKNDDSDSAIADRIITSTNADIVLPADTAVLLQYEDVPGIETHWHVLAAPSSVGSLLSTAFIQGGSSFGATGTLGTNDFYGLNIETGGVTALALDTSGNATLTGGLTVSGGSVATPAATSFSLTSGTTGAVTLDSGTTGAVNLGTGSNAKTVTIGNTTGATAVAIKSGSGGIALTGNTSLVGASSFTSGTGGVDVLGNFANSRGTDYTASGAQNDVNLGAGALFIYTGAGVTITGLAGGTDGRIVRIMNDSSSDLTVTDQDAASSPANRIVTTNGISNVIGPDGTIGFQYDASASRWRVITIPSEQLSFNQGGSAFGTTGIIGTTDAYPLDIVTGGANALTLDTSGNATLTGGLTVTGGSVATPAATSFSLTSGTTGNLTLDSGTTGAINLGTGSNAKTITIGNATGGTAVDINSGTGNIDLQPAGTGATGDVQIGAGGSGSATPDLLVLDVKNDSATDPTGTNGASYYNSVSNKFRCFEGGAWKDCDTTGGTTTLQTAYNSGSTITTSGSTDLALTLASGNFTASGAGSVNLTPTGASSFTSGGALTLTGGAASTWGTTAGNLDITSGGGQVQIGTGGAGTATPDVLVLDVKSAGSGAGDPAGGTNGAMYYNSSTTTFRCYAGGLWQDCNTAGGGALESLNGQSGASQTLVTGTAGTDFNIVSGSNVHTFNIPDASTTNRGLVTSGTQTFGGQKTFNNDLLVNGNTTLGDAGGDAVTVNAATLTLAGNSTVVDMTGTGTLSFDTVTNQPITVGSGLFTANGAATVTGTFTNPGNYVTPKGTDHSTTGSQNNVNLGTGSLFRYTGSAQATFTGITGGTDGRFIRITNASSSNLLFTNQDSASTAANRIITTTSGTLTIPPDVSVGFQYDAGVSRWRTVVLPATSSTLASTVFIQNGNSFGATATLGTNDANSLDLVTGGSNALTLDTSGNAVLTGGLTVNGGSVVTPAATALNVTTGTTGALTLDSGTTGAVNLGTGSNAKTVTIGNTTGATQVDINTGSGNAAITAATTSFKTSTATNDQLALVPHAGGGASFTGMITSADLTGSGKTWTFPNLTGNILLDTSTCPTAGSFACNGGNGIGSTFSVGTMDANPVDIITGGATALALDTSGNAVLTGTLTVNGGSVATPAATALNVTTGTTGALTLDSGTTGAVNLGTGSNAKTVTIGNTTGATAVAIKSGSAASRSPATRASAVPVRSRRAPARRQSTRQPSPSPATAPSST